MNTRYYKIAAAAFAALLLMICCGSCRADPNDLIDGGIAETVMPPTEFRLLKKGSEGEDVFALQERLSELGYFLSEPNGIFGETTAKAVLSFQRRNGLDADALAGKATQTCLFGLNPVPAPEHRTVNVLEGKLPYLTNKSSPVDEAFVPENLILLTDVCPENLVKIKYPDTMAVREAAEALVKMLEAAQKEGIKKWQISSGYRSYEDQENTLNAKMKSYLRKNPNWSRNKARNAALKTVAEPGTSEHHLGLAFDINVPNTEAFSSTKQCKWLHKNCWDYGFIVRYQKGKEKITGFSAEAWHIRYVGSEHSKIIRNMDFCLEEYLEWADEKEQDELEITEEIEEYFH